MDAEIDGDFFEEFKNGEAKNDYDIEAVVNWMEEEHLNDQIMKSINQDFNFCSLLYPKLSNENFS